MIKQSLNFLIIFILLTSFTSFSQTTVDTITLRDIEWDSSSPATMKELNIPSGESLLQGFIYKANGSQKHPTLILLHGYPGNERNLDLAQVARYHGWNVIYFDYRGSWGSQGEFSFKNCVEDVVHVVDYCKKNENALQIDTSNIVLFGHSMGGWICLKALQVLPGIKKGFALSTWDIYENFKDVKNNEQLEKTAKLAGEYFVLNTPAKSIFEPVVKNLSYYNLANPASALSDRQIIMLDEHNGNNKLAETLKDVNKSYFKYEVWHTDHPFTNKRVALIKMVLDFLDK